MKFCKSKVWEYSGPNGTQTVVHYITFDDLKQRHGEQFADQWLKFAKIYNLQESKFNNESGYYESDYRFYARMTDQFINAV